MVNNRWTAWSVCVAACALLLSHCVGRSVPEERFQDSLTLQNLPLPITVPHPEQFSFAVVGDLHVNGSDTTRLKTIVAAAEAEGDSFLVLLGDISDQGERAEVEAYRSALLEAGWLQKTLFVIGNHDIFGGGWPHYLELNGPSLYAVTIGSSRFIALDTADGTVGSLGVEWLEDQLNQPRPRHTFVLSHYLPVIPGESTYLKLGNEAEAIRLMKMVTEQKVTAWLGAHYHSFLMGRIDGVDYVVAGGGGGRRMDPIHDYFFVQVTVSGPQVSYHMRVVN